MQRTGLEPGRITYSAAVVTYKRGKQPGIALELLEDMQGAGLGPGMTSYCAAICACEMGELPDVALEILRTCGGKGWNPACHLRCCDQRLRFGQAAGHGLGAP